MLTRGANWLLGETGNLLLILIAAALVPTAYGQTVANLPDWNDEADAYRAQNLDSANSRLHISDGRYSSDNLATFTGLSDISDTHDDTEGDDLWTAYKMHQRLDGIHPEAAADWFSRAQNLATFFKTGYVGGAAWSKDTTYNHDHIYGWGLCEWAMGEGDAAAANTVDQLIQEMVDWNANDFVADPGDNLFSVGSGGRRWARQLKLAVCAADLSPTTTNISWRDKVIDLMMQSSAWDPNYKMYWLSSSPTNSRLGSGAYENGQRIAITFHMGIWADALWDAWKALDAQGDSRASSVRQRIIDIATFYRDIPLDAGGFLQLHLGYNVNSGQAINTGGDGSPDGVYSIAPINGLVFAYKFTGDQSFLDRAWTLFRNWQFSKSGAVGQVNHFVDAEIASATAFRFLGNNKGELQYVHALFENGGQPTLVGDTPPVVRPLPPTILVGDNSPSVSASISASPSSIDPGNTAQLTWSSTGADSCTASDGWGGSRPLSGTETTPVLTETTKFTITCTSQAGSDTNSVWVSVSGATGSTPGNIPSWYANAPERTWINMTNAVGAFRWAGGEIHPEEGSAIPNENRIILGSFQDDHEGAIRKWNGAIAREDFYVLALGGGHNGGSGNVIYEFGPFTSETPNWHHYGTDPAKYQRPSDNLNWRSNWNNNGEWCRDSASGAPLAEQGFYSDGLPASRHTYSQGVFIPELSDGTGRQGFWPRLTGIWCSDSNSASSKAASITFRSNIDVGADYDPKDTWPDAIGSGRFGGAVFDPVSEKVFALHFGSGSSGSVVEYDPKTKTRRSLSEGAPGLGKTGALALDPDRRIIILHNASNGGRLLVVDIDHDGRVGGNYGSVTEVRYSSGPLDHQASAEYHPNSSAFIGYDGGSTIYKMSPPNDYRTGGMTGSVNSGSSWSWSAITNASGGASPSSDTDEGGLQSRFRYISSIDAFAVIVNSAGKGVSGTPDDNFYVYKIPQQGF